MKRAVVVFLVVVTLFGVAMPRAEAYVVAPPPPVMLPPTVTAPPALGLCSTPVGVLICAGFVGAAIADGWTYDEEVDVRGLGYVEDAQGNRWEICDYLASGELRCSGDWSGGGSTWDGPAVKSQYENLEALKDYGWYPPDGTEVYVSPLDQPTALVVPKYQSGYQDALAVGAEFLGGWTHLSDDGRQLTIEVFFKTVNGCPRVERDAEWLALGSNSKRYPEWVSCTGISILGGTNMGSNGAPNQGALTAPDDVTCSDSGVPTFEGYAGGAGSGITVTCPPGTTIVGYDYNGPVEPDHGLNRHFRVPICSVGPGGFVDLFNNNCTDGATHPPVLVWVTLSDEEVPSRQAVMHTWCRDEDGGLTLRTSYGPEVPVFVDEVPIPDPDCGPGEVPVKWEAEVCEVEWFGDECVRTGSGEIPGLDGMTDNELSCVQLLASPTPCPMWLEVFDEGEWEYCDPAAANCVGWWNHPDRELLYRCGWGGDYYSASQCVALKDFYDVEEGGDVGTQPEPGVSNPDPDPTDIGTYRITVTGPQNPVSARPNVPWYRRVITEWATGSTADMQGACWPQGWGLLNPLQWVLRPIMCALTWAFVPTTSVEARLENIRGEWEARTGLVPEIIPEVAAPVVGGTCGWGFGSVDTPSLGAIPEVDIIWCPAEHGVTTQAALMRGLGLGALGFMVVSMVMRWVSMRSSHEAGVHEGFQGSMS